MLQDELPGIARLIRGQRIAAFGTLADGAPFVSMVAYAVEDDLCGYLVHLSGMAAHTRQMRADPRVSLMIAEPETPQVDDVQTLARITLQGSATAISKETPAYALGRTRYLERHPAAAMLFDFADFDLFRIAITSARYVGGFARAYTLTGRQLAQAAGGEDLDR